MKVVLNNGKEYEVSMATPYSEINLCIGFINIKSYDELREALTPEALSIIKYYPVEDSESYDTYEDYTEFVKSTVTNNDSGTLDVVMYLKKVDATTKTIQEMQRQILEMKEQNASLQETVDTLVLDNLEE